MSENNDNNNNNNSPSKTPTTTIKIAAKDASQGAQGGADPGPGDPSAAPSGVPELVEIPDPPTPSQLIVKSVKSEDNQDSATAKGSSPQGSRTTVKGSSPATKTTTTKGSSPGNKTTTRAVSPGTKTQHFRYHKRVTVRTKGKTSPNAIMDKVNYKDHKAGITPSSIEDMDPQELMKRAGIKETKKGTHWRVRLRQTEKITKNGKTITQTKVAYRDSEGNKRIKTSKTPNCEKCGKRLEDCECDSTTKE